MKQTQTILATERDPIQPVFYLPDETGTRLSKIYQIHTPELSPEGNPMVILQLDNLKMKYGMKYFLLAMEGSSTRFRSQLQIQFHRNQ